MWIIDAYFDNKKLTFYARNVDLKEKLGVTITAADIDDFQKLKFGHLGTKNKN